MNKDILTQIVRVWQNRLGLDDWEIEIIWDEIEEDDDTYAFVWRARDYREARIRWNKNWQNWNEKRANEIVVHELLHLSTHQLEFILDLLEEQLHRDVDSVICKMYNHHMEGVIDYLAKRIIAFGGIVGVDSTHNANINLDYPY